MASPRTISPDYTPIQGLAVSETGEHAPEPRSNATGVYHRAEHRGGGMPPWLFTIALLFGGGASGGVIGAGVGVFGSTEDVEALERDIEAHRARLDDHDDDLKVLRSEQLRQHRWIANELVKQGKALGSIGAKVGASVDVEVAQYESEGL